MMTSFKFPIIIKSHSKLFTKISVDVVLENPCSIIEPEPIKVIEDQSGLKSSIENLMGGK